ncbi:MAG: heavy metal translocating P-type ATPase [Planctomycetaceae bacterium]|nr:heavy metal translocating P-type ATPase [Planctomycetales bacterium]MCB9937004.1 heavy metal translocating P-type ATPase [Planctomycetaceae bacterium]
MTTTQIALRIDELDCAEEVVLLQDQLNGSRGIQDLGFDVVNRRMVVSFEADQVSVDDIITRISKIGMHASREDQPRESVSKSGVQNLRLLLTLAAGIAITAGFVTHVATTGNLLAPFEVELLDSKQSNPVASQILYSLSIGLGLWFVLPKAWFALRRLRADMNLLMCVAVVGAICLGQWLEAAIVTFLFQVSLLLEHWSMDRARRAVSSLLNLTPPTARVVHVGSDHTHERPVAEVKLGARIIVHPAEMIPLDGRVLAGDSSVNQAPITGESLSVAKSIDDDVFAGTINGEGSLEIEVTRLANDTTLARIVHLVQDAHASRAPSEQWVEKFARYYTPAMMGLALLIAMVPPLLFAAAWSSWIYNALVLLVIACPCALVISTPVSVVSALTRAANHGVLVKGGRYLEAAAGIQAIAIDKTGTLTRGEPVVQEVIPLNSHSRVELLQRAAALESQSTHPIARAILDCARNEGVQVAKAESYQQLSGRGAEGIVSGKPYWIGSHRLMLERMPHADAAHNQSINLKASGGSVVAIGSEAHVCGLISVADTVRDGAEHVIQELHDLGVRHIRMLTGDNQETGQTIAAAVGIDSFLAEALPEDKLRELERLREQYGSVAMIGDGVNDSPALAAATIGIVMGAIGTDAAIEAADIALMSDDLSRVPWLIRLARRTLRIIKQNIAFALGLKLLFVGLAACGLASLWMAIAADTGASLLVVFNGMRLLRK